LSSVRVVRKIACRHFKDEAMREKPPDGLIDKLQRLGLATAADLEAAERCVARTACDLPRCESLWIDALVQLRTLTPYQAFQWNAGHGQELAIGPYVLCQPRPRCDFLPCYRARHRQSSENVLLTVCGNASPQVLEQAERLIVASAGLRHQALVPVQAAGLDGSRLWIASPWIDGLTAAEWLIHHGRLPPPLVCEIGRDMAAALAALHAADLCHGDVSPSSLLLAGDGSIQLLHAGLRGIVRPREGYAQADLRPEAYATLAPERIAEGSPPTAASDLYGWACVCWQLLCGRAPVAGGDSLGTLRAAHSATIGDVRPLAPDVPAELAAAIARCTERDPHDRPQSADELLGLLGAGNRRSRAALVRGLAQPARVRLLAHTTRERRKPRHAAGRLTAAAALAMLLAAVVWPLWSRWPASRPSLPLVAASRLATRPAAKATTRDPAVTPAHFEAEVAERIPAAIVLPGDRPVAADTLALHAGQSVRGPRGGRATIIVPRGGWLLRTENLRFENVDFRPAADGAASASDTLPALVRLSAACAEFHRCTFSSPAGAPVLPAAIGWLPHGARVADPLALPAGRLRLAHCALLRMGCGIDCHAPGALNVQLDNTLYLGRGALVRLEHAPAADEPLQLALQQVTLRDCGPLVQCDGAGDGARGLITVHAADCVFAPAADTPLVLLACDVAATTTGNVKWTGQGSLVLPDTAIAAWHTRDGHTHVWDDARIAIAGLVRSRVEFAGAADGSPAASRAVGWQAPLQSPDAPGIDPRLLP
jgi:hypothetical protein